MSAKVSRGASAACWRAGAAAQHRADPGEHLLEAERLGDVVVAAEGEAGDLVLGGVAGGEEQHGRVPARCAQPPDDVEAVQVRHHHVEHDQVGAERVGQGERLLAVGGRGDLEAGEAQAGREQLEDVGLVVDDEQPGLGRGCPAVWRTAGHGSSGRACGSRSSWQRAWARRLGSLWTLPVNSLGAVTGGDIARPRRQYPIAWCCARPRPQRPRRSARMAADGGGLGGRPTRRRRPRRAVQRGDGVGEQGALAGRGVVAVQPAHGDPVRSRQRLLLRGAGDLEQRDPAWSWPGRGQDPADRRAARSRPRPAGAARPAGRPREPAPATAKQGARSGGGCPGGRRAVAVQDEVDLHLAGDRVLTAGGVAAQAHPVGARRARRCARPWPPAATADRDRPPAGPAG